MSCSNNTGYDIKMPSPRPMAAAPGCAGTPIQGPGPVIPNASTPFNPDRFPIGMGYVPMQQWGQTYPLAQAFNRGTIFPELDYPFAMGRCAR